jgi:hypothetical protein
VGDSITPPAPDESANAPSGTYWVGIGIATSAIALAIVLAIVAFVRVKGATPTS